MSHADEDVRIRPMTFADLDRVIGIAQTLKDAPHWPHSAYVAALDREATPRRIALVAEAPETSAVVAFAVTSLQPPQAELETIAVATEHQRRGIARRLFTAMVEELKTAAISEVLLEVRASNSSALAFYQTLGFIETGRRPRYYADPVEDAVLLELRLE